VGSVQDAVVVLGLASVRALVVASALTRAFDGAAAADFDAHAFWRHSLATAAAAGELARRTGADGAALFLAGILHDMGRLALFATFPAAGEAVAAHRRAGGLAWHEAEAAVLGFDHAAIGGALCDHWHFPAAIGAAVAGHHAPEDAGRWADVVHAADAIAHALDLAGEADAAVPPQADGAWERLGLGWDELRQVLAATEGRFAGLLSILD
jgi:putative nucleotidyltransferase with HDIG domain